MPQTQICKQILEDLRQAMYDNDTESVKGILFGDVVSELLEASDDVPVAADWLTQASMCLKCGQAEEKGCPYCPVATGNNQPAVIRDSQ